MLFVAVGIRFVRADFLAIDRAQLVFREAVNLWRTHTHARAGLAGVYRSAVDNNPRAKQNLLYGGVFQLSDRNVT